jgi:hypothetical protein
MADLDYAPVGIYDDDELTRNLRLGGYAPAVPDSTAPPAAPPAAAPPVGSTADLESRPRISPITAPEAPAAGSTEDLESRAASPIIPAAAAPERPQWEDYAPAQPKGWGKVGHFLAGLSPLTNAYFNQRPLAQAERNYSKATAEYEAPISDAEKEAQTEEAKARADALEHPPTKQEAEGKTVTTDQGIFQWNPATSRYDIKVGAAPAKNEKPDSLDQQYEDAIEKNDTAAAARILKVKEDMARAGRNPEEGTWQIAEGPDGKPVLFNSKTGETKAAPAGVAKAGTHAKADTELKKQQQPYQDILDSIDEARDYAKEQSGPGDYALLLRVVDATKPAKGFRFTQSEQNLLIGARSLANSADALYQKAAGGQLLTPDQRKQMLDVLGIVEKHAQTRMQELGGTGGQNTKAPAVGAVEGGYRFKGGDASKQENWEKVSTK